MKSVIVTGASRGIGAAIAKTLAKSGYAVVVNYNKTAEKANALCQEIQNFGGIAFPVQGDISSSDDVQRIFNASYEQFGAPYALINNAGIALRGAPLQDITDSEIEAVIAVNLTGTIKCSREAIKYMVREHRGKIVSISSIWGQIGGSCEVAYSASKAGIIGLTKALSNEVAPSGISVNCIAPGVIDTDMLSCYSEADLNALRDETPLGRLGTPEDIANAVEFLISEKSSFITGQIIGINGGTTG